MYSLLQKYITQNSPVSAEVFNNSKPFFTAAKVPKGKLLLLAGEVCRHLYFINKGCLRTYYLNKQAQEKTRFIAFEGIMASSLASFISQQPSFEYLEALEDCELLSITRNDFFNLVEANSGWQVFYQTFLEQAYIHQNKKIETLVTLTAKQRYTDLMEQNPHYIKRLPNKVLATYLSISQETLSRLKSK
jgi:CRP-like cAMP-binding protein